MRVHIREKLREGTANTVGNANHEPPPISEIDLYFWGTGHQTVTKPALRSRMKAATMSQDGSSPHHYDALLIPEGSPTVLQSDGVSAHAATTPR